MLGFASERTCSAASASPSCFRRFASSLRALVKRLGQLEARAEAAEREANRARIAASEAEAAAAERRQEAEAAAAELEELSE